jgi:hypothetical protein
VSATSTSCAPGKHSPSISTTDEARAAACLDGAAVDALDPQLAPLAGSARSSARGAAGKLRVEIADSGQPPGSWGTVWAAPGSPARLYGEGTASGHRQRRHAGGHGDFK